MNLDSKLFDATLDLERVKVSVRTLVKLFRQEQSAIIRTLNEFGFLLLRSEHGEDRQELLALKELFGRAAPHPRADADGIVPISNARYVSGYLGSTPLEHKLHTDGAFLDTPEQLCSLQCVRNAREGGETLLASAGLAFERLRRRMPTKHLGLLRGDALTIVRKHQSSTQPVFRLNGEALGIKFRQNDGAAEVVEHPVAVEAFAELVAALEDPACQLRIKLEPGEILVLDNTAVLHGRTAFCANELREMRRLNFDGHGRLRAELELGFKVGL
ncbi:TPA: TauD/TfdA family dioxygenase [Pseudomonas aeruginosa]|nr:TauD/TfdA family dioxygenase [Pseudomonas aeruginosa]HEK2440324.1 TauD/TfdA family dioxygenase [Pseudomonas aeruginosa]